LRPSAGSAIKLTMTYRERTDGFYPDAAAMAAGTLPLSPLLLLGLIGDRRVRWRSARRSIAGAAQLLRRVEPAIQTYSEGAGICPQGV